VYRQCFELHGYVTADRDERMGSFGNGADRDSDQADVGSGFAEIVLADLKRLRTISCSVMDHETHPILHCNTLTSWHVT
jgi:hypothetical protein